MSQERMENSKIRMSKGLALFWHVAQSSHKDVDQDSQVIGIKVVSRLLGCKEETEELQDQQLHTQILITRAARSIEHKDEILSKRLGNVQSRLEGQHDDVVIALTLM